MCDGRISCCEFNADVENFVQESKALGDNWEVRLAPECLQFGPTQSVKYLVKQCFREVEAKNATPEAFQDSELDVLSNTEKDDCEAERDDSLKSYVKYEYHVIYSPSYGVPVLYFTACTQDGCPLGLQDVWSTVSSVYQQRLQAERWTFLTQQEHPYLGKPFFQLHPCHTVDLMKAILDRDDKSLETKRKTSYLVTWLSSVGPVVGLQLPLAYGT